MTEDEAKAWLRTAQDVPRETLVQLDAYLTLLRDAMGQQNLIAESSWPHVWARHVVDSAQLLRLAPAPANGDMWLDLGSGAGFPGLVVALISSWSVTMVESRRKRVVFLENCVSRLGLAGRCEILGRPLERIAPFPAAVISARAFAPLPKLLRLSAPFSTEKTVWLLPKGRNAAGELDRIAPSWRQMFHVEPSLTDADSGIVMGKGGGRRYRGE